MSDEVVTLDAAVSSESGEEETTLKVPKTTMQEVVDYMAKRPYGEVFTCMNKLLAEITKLNPED